MDPVPDDRPRIGISACLLGDQVRFDGGHKRDVFLTDVLAPHVHFVRVCPEVEVGMGTPRETVRLVRADRATVRMVTTRTGIDHTDAMVAWSKRRLSELERENLSGYILKKDSPSCGMERVTVFDGSGVSDRSGTGIFAAALLQRFGNLPVEEEGRLSDPRLRENFIERVFAYQRLRRLFAGRWTAGGLVQFHTAQEMSLRSHSAARCRELGQLVAAAATMARDALRTEYESRFMATLAVIATTRRHTDVLMRMAGHLKTLLDPASKQELTTRIAEYRRGLVPLVVPLTLLRHHVRTHQVAYLLGQTYLEPHPHELLLERRA